MSGYNGEPEKMAPTWKSENTDRFEYGPVLRRVANAIINKSLVGNNLERGILRLCEASSVSDSVECRTSLGQIAGIPFSETEVYKNAIGRDINNQDMQQVLRVLEVAKDAHYLGNFDRYDLITASVGFFPYPVEVIEQVLA